jgi:membrane protein DedA with SNARE-associated domain
MAPVTSSIFSFLVDKITTLPAWLVLVTVLLLAFSEAALFVGFVLPGETAVIIGGVAASRDHLNIVLLTVLVCVAAIAGDSVGYYIGEHHGDKLLKLPIIRHRHGAINTALETLKRRGPIFVFVGRFTAFLRAVMPGLAGMSRLEYRRFLMANAAGGIVWGTSFTMLGYLSGHALHKMEKYVSRFGWVLLAGVITLAIWHHIHSARKAQEFERHYAETHPEEGASN